MDRKEKRKLIRRLAKEFGVAAVVWGLLTLAILFATASVEFTYAMY
jgi:hypothetical protein